MSFRTQFKLMIVLSLGVPAVSMAAPSAKAIMEDGAQTYPPNNGNVCVLSGPPPEDLEYVVLARIVATKRTYGGTDQLYAPMVREARMIGADAIINLQASQRFKGPLPWRITSPTGDGQAIKVLPESPALDCVRIGGTLWGTSGPVAGYLVLPTKVETSATNQNDKSSSEYVGDSEANSKIDLYKELLKLDDLRQRGILTDEEFQAEKKKLLDEN